MFYLKTLHEPSLHLLRVTGFWFPVAGRHTALCSPGHENVASTLQYLHLWILPPVGGKNGVSYVASFGEAAKTEIVKLKLLLIQILLILMTI